jgi:hypothetical protein
MRHNVGREAPPHHPTKTTQTSAGEFVKPLTHLSSILSTWPPEGRRPNTERCIMTDEHTQARQRGKHKQADSQGPCANARTSANMWTPEFWGAAQLNSQRTFPNKNGESLVMFSQAGVSLQAPHSTAHNLHTFIFRVQSASFYDLSREVIHTDAAPAAIGPFSQASLEFT